MQTQTATKRYSKNAERIISTYESIRKWYSPRAPKSWFGRITFWIGKIWRWISGERPITITEVIAFCAWVHEVVECGIYREIASKGGGERLEPLVLPYHEDHLNSEEVEGVLTPIIVIGYGALFSAFLSLRKPRCRRIFQLFDPEVGFAKLINVAGDPPILRDIREDKVYRFSEVGTLVDRFYERCKAETKKFPGLWRYVWLGDTALWMSTIPGDYEEACLPTQFDNITRVSRLVTAEAVYNHATRYGYDNYFRVKIEILLLFAIESHGGADGFQEFLWKARNVNGKYSDEIVGEILVKAQEQIEKASASPSKFHQYLHESLIVALEPSFSF
jgi:hypothetical protein